LDGKDFDILSLDLGIKPLNLDGKEYILFVGENLGQRNYRIYDSDTKADITDPIILDKLKGLIKSLYAKPSVVTY
jgi:expansin (peptidoglycan-binding protein)